MKTTVLAMFILALSIVSNAHALTGYTQTFSYSQVFPLNSGDDVHQTTSFYFDGVSNQFSANPQSPSLSLDLTGSNSFSDDLNIVLMLGSTYIATLNSDHPTIYFNTPEMLGNLNSAIINERVSFEVLWTGGSSKLKSATLSGTLAPEPTSALLVAAGLGSLPLLRRLRKRHS